MKVEKYRVLGELIETNKRQFVIPVYQRNYDWEKSHCKKLFDDILSAYQLDRFHFIGSIVYVDQGEENKIYRYLIIDGQQRITTLFLLLKALLDSTDNENLKKEIEDILFNVDKYNDLKLTEQTKIKLKPIKTDNDQFLLLMKNDFDAIDRSSNIYVNYDYMKKLIQKAVAGGDNVKDILSGMKKLTSAVIILDPKEDDPQVVFESINSTGLDLSLADLIRNFILMTDKDQEKLFEMYWVKIECNIGQRNMPAFITDFLQFACRENVTNQNAYEAFKNYFKTEQFTNEQLLATLLHYSEYYKAFLGNSNNKYSNEVNRKLSGFKALDQATIYPFLFHVFDDYESGIISMVALEKVLTFFLNYLMRRIVCGVGSNSLRGLYKTLYNRIFADKENLENYFDAIVAFFMQVNTKNAIPSDSLFKDSLMNTDIYNKKNACKYILKTIEEMTEDGTVNKEILDVSTFSIEHIMPQKLSDYWKQALGANFEKVHEKYLHNLGNLTLTGYNSELGQKTFEEKKQLITDKNSHIVVLNKDVLSQSVWNETTIKARANRLSALLLKLFYIEKSTKNIEFQDTTERRLSVGENFDATGTKPKSCIFIGTTISVSSYADMLSKIMESFYDLDNNLISELAKNNFKLPGAARVYITNDESVLRRAVEIYETGIFFEANLSANNIISFLKSVLDVFELDYSELVFCIDTKNVSTTENDKADLHNITALQDMKVGKLSELIFEKLLTEELIDDEEVARLLDKEYSKKTFGIYYPVLARNREDNKGQGEQVRYKKTPYTYKGTDYYLTREWFEQNKENLLTYVKNLFV